MADMAEILRQISQIIDLLTGIPSVNLRKIL